MEVKIPNTLNSKPPDVPVSERDDLYCIADTVHVGDVVKVKAVDWAIREGPVSMLGPFSVVRAKNYGQVLAIDNEGLTIAPQVFEDEHVRYALTMPIVTIEEVTVLERAE